MPQNFGPGAAGRVEAVDLNVAEWRPDPNAPAEPNARAAAPRLHRETFRTSRLLEFCTKKELVAQTGHRIEDWPLVILKELVDNALDGAEEARIGPEITMSVSTDTGVISIVDNGPGIPSDTITGILDYNVRVSSREAYCSPSRGAQGNALKTVLAMAFALSGQRGETIIEAQGLSHRIAFSVDQLRQEPVIAPEVARMPTPAGTTVTVFWPDTACSSQRADFQGAAARHRGDGAEMTEYGGACNPAASAARSASAHPRASARIPIGRPQMNIQSIAENPEQGKDRPHLPDDLDDFREALSFEIERAADCDLPSAGFVQLVAETIARDDTMSPDTQEKLILLGLMNHVWDVLAPDQTHHLIRLSLTNWNCGRHWRATTRCRRAPKTRQKKRRLLPGTALLPG